MTLRIPGTPETKEDRLYETIRGKLSNSGFYPKQSIIIEPGGKIQEVPPNSNYPGKIDLFAFSPVKYIFNELLKFLINEGYITGLVAAPNNVSEYDFERKIIVIGEQADNLSGRIPYIFLSSDVKIPFSSYALTHEIWHAFQNFRAHKQGKNSVYEYIIPIYNEIRNTFYSHLEKVLKQGHNDISFEELVIGGVNNPLRNLISNTQDPYSSLCAISILIKLRSKGELGLSFLTNDNIYSHQEPAVEIITKTIEEVNELLNMITWSPTAFWNFLHQLHSFPEVHNLKYFNLPLSLSYHILDLIKKVYIETLKSLGLSYKEEIKKIEKNLAYILTPSKGDFLTSPNNPFFSPLTEIYVVGINQKY